MLHFVKWRELKMKPLRYNKPFLLMVLNAGPSILFLEEGGDQLVHYCF